MSFIALPPRMEAQRWHTLGFVSFLTVDIIPQSSHVESFVPFRFIDTETVLYAGNSVIGGRPIMPIK